MLEIRIDVVTMRVPPSKPGRDNVKVDGQDPSQASKPADPGEIAKEGRQISGPLSDLTLRAPPSPGKQKAADDGATPLSPPPLKPTRTASDIEFSSNLLELSALARESGGSRSAEESVSGKGAGRGAQAARVVARWALRNGPRDVFSGRLLTLLSSKDLNDLVGDAIGIEDEGQRADALARLGAGMEDLSAPEHESLRDRLVDAAIGINDEGAKAVALAGVGSGIAYLSAPQQRRLVDAVVSMEPGGGMAIALASIGLGMGRAKRT
ncbi:hypothetical protein FAZ69_15300 [Trinickia terrae]|uniref:Uncharacterized protein n=1 Tax=Trinickia terrae TaxID=2571161 RepID=A0A4U1I342_9BURK|nr:hypothetical protein [Trinickia terrae]TKC87661.1 hypothetical protein FAZ69_15300 [Trinickia terrae]